MDRNVRYEVLQNEEEHVPAEPVNLTMVLPPPAYNEAVANGSESIESAVMNQIPGKLPSYEVATTLPSYEEAEQSKQEEEERKRLTDETEPKSTDAENGENEQITQIEIGTDGIFLCTFILAFVFNWIGFLASICLSYSVAGRSGALSGLGLSIVKWVAIVKHKDWASNVLSGDSFLWWLLIICGFMIFVRGAVQYVRIKYEWQRLTGLYRRIPPI